MDPNFRIGAGEARTGPGDLAREGWRGPTAVAPAGLKPWRLLGLGACLGSWCSDGDFVLVQVVRLCHEGAGGVLLLDDVGVAPRHVVDVLRHLLEQAECGPLRDVVRDWVLFVRGVFGGALLDELSHQRTQRVVDRVPVAAQLPLQVVHLANLPIVPIGGVAVSSRLRREHNLLDGALDGLEHRVADLVEPRAAAAGGARRRGERAVREAEQLEQPHPRALEPPQRAVIVVAGERRHRVDGGLGFGLGEERAQRAHLGVQPAGGLAHRAADDTRLGLRVARSVADVLERCRQAALRSLQVRLEQWPRALRIRLPDEGDEDGDGAAEEGLREPRHGAPLERLRVVDVRLVAVPVEADSDDGRREGRDQSRVAVVAVVVHPREDHREGDQLDPQRQHAVAGKVHEEEREDAAEVGADEPPPHPRLGEDVGVRARLEDEDDRDGAEDGQVRDEVGRRPRGGGAAADGVELHPAKRGRDDEHQRRARGEQPARPRRDGELVLVHEPLDGRVELRVVLLDVEAAREGRLRV
mmetsp:Transcript_51982/g.119586  ORF Transcript_51982/g.119586 Transcript_51982/m.119586 type:complete len:526 (-) Transcript_51982:4-1581(-)